MSVIDTKKGYVLPEMILNESDLASILPRDILIPIEELFLSADPLFENLIKDHEKPVTTVMKDFELAPPEAGEIPTKAGFSKPVIIETHHFPLHDAAKKNDVDKIRELVNAGEDVNKEDNLSSRPFHMAAFYGANQALSQLIALGSNLKDKALGGFNALDLALRNKHYETARTLVETNEFDVNTHSPDGKTPLLRAYEALEAQISSYMPAQLDSIIATLKEMVLRTPVCYIKEEGSYIPLVMKVKALMSYTTSAEDYDKFSELVQVIEHQDPSYDAFISCLDLLHHFPTGNTYDFKLPTGKKVTFDPEGHYPQYTTKLAYDSLSAYLLQLDDTNSTAAEREVFGTLQEIYRDAVVFKQKMLQPEVINDALELYNQGETILLPSGWQGHFINIILNKEMGLYVTANSGERYQGEVPSVTNSDGSPGDPPGLLFYHMEDNNNIDFNFIQTTLANHDKFQLELSHHHEYGLNKRVYEIITDEQIFNNCATESHRNAIEGLLFIELMHGGMAHDDARRLAKTYFEKWDTFHGNFVIDRYIDKGHGLDVESIIDIYKSVLEKSDPHHHGPKLFNLLQSDHYHADFTQWLRDHGSDLENQAFIQDLQVSHHIDVATVLTSPEMPVASHESHPAPHFINLAHEVLPVEVF